MKFRARITPELLDRFSRNKRHNDRLSSRYLCNVFEELVPCDAFRDSIILKGIQSSEVGNRYLDRAETNLEDSKEHSRRIELELHEACDEIDQLKWKLENAETEAKLQVARATERARADHRKELDSRDELIALLKEKLSRLGKQKAKDTDVPPQASSSGSGCLPDPLPKKATDSVMSNG